MKVDIKNLPEQQLQEFLISQGEKPFRAAQLMKWLFQKGISSFSEMTDLSKAFREKLEESCEMSLLKIKQKQISTDGTQKFLFELSDGKTIESVYMPLHDRITLCVSTQVGCRMGCTFCLTAKQGLVRNLTASEIVNQVLAVQKNLNCRVTNIVMMGMGEPLDNYDSVIAALHILQSRWAFKISQRRITVSTVGLISAIERFGQDSDVNLAISLNAPNDEIRTQIMPINRKYHLSQLFQACKHYPLKPTRRITFEYVLLGGLNDSVEHARELAKQIKGIRCKVNLIPFNEHPMGLYQRPSEQTLLAFQNVLIDHHLTATIRYSRGRDILAACGQLVSK